MGDILFKTHTGSSRWVVGICDEELYGRILQEGNYRLDLTGPFFKGEPLDKTQIKKEIERCAAEDATFNIIGEQAVQTALETGIIQKEGVIIIEEVPVALVLL